MAQQFSELELDNLTDRANHDVKIEKVTSGSCTEVIIEAPVWGVAGRGKICSVTLKPEGHCEHRNPVFRKTDTDATTKDWYTEKGFASGRLNSGEFDRP